MTPSFLLWIEVLLLPAPWKVPEVLFEALL